MQRTIPKLLVIGLDGAPYPLIKQWSEEGFLPNTARLIDQGSFGVLRSTIPVHSPTAWASFMTGLNPGKHGVFDFAQREPDSYRLRLIQAHQIHGPKLWHILSQNGRRVGVMNVPMTYPPEPVNGFLISGLGTPAYTTYTYPPELSETLNQQGYRVNKEKFYAPGQEDEWLADIYDTSRRRAETAVQLIQQQDWDFFMLVFRNTDEICHFFWRYMDDTHPLYDPNVPDKHKTAIRDYYQQVDEWTGQIIQAAGKDTNIVIMSDHGAGPLYKDVFLNEWLWQQGWLKMKKTSSHQKASLKMLRQIGLTRQNISNLLTRLHLHRLEILIKKSLGDRIQILPRDERPEFTAAIDWSQTSAYSFGYYGQIFINLRGREPQGIIEPGSEYDSLRREIVQRLSKLVDPMDGQPVVDKIYFKEELYHGEHLNTAPDIITIMRDLTYITRKGYEFAPERGLLFQKPHHESGGHRFEGILIAAGPDVVNQASLAECKIWDLAPTLLYLLQIQVPHSMDGEVILPLIQPQSLAHYPVVYTDHKYQAIPTQTGVLDDETEQELVEQLKKLGYLQ